MKKFAEPLVGLALVAGLLALSCAQVDALSLGAKNQTLVKPVSSARDLGGFAHPQLAYSPVQHVGAYEAPLLQQQPYVQPSYAPLVQQPSYSLPIVQSYEQPIVHLQAYPSGGAYSPAANYSAPSYVAPVAHLPAYHHQPPAYGQQQVHANYSQQAYQAAPLVQAAYSSAPYSASLRPTSYGTSSPGYGVHLDAYHQSPGYATAPVAYPAHSYAASNYTSSPAYGAHVPSSYASIQTEPYGQHLYQPVAHGYQQLTGGYLATPLQQQQHYQPALSSGVSWILKRQLNDTAQPADSVNSSSSSSSNSSTVSTPTIASSTDLAAETLLYSADQTKSESSVGPTFALPPSGFAPTNVATYRPAAVVQVQAPVKQALDIQPEFTQAWADFAQPPGYLPLAYKNIPLYHYHQSQYVKQHQGFYNSINTQLAQALAQNIGFGYVTWSGPINPASFYTPVQPLYFYKIPPLSPFYKLNPGAKLAPSAYLQNQPQYQPQHQQYQQLGQVQQKY